MKQPRPGVPGSGLPRLKTKLSACGMSELFLDRAARVLLRFFRLAMIARMRVERKRG
jgi:hypothetical protein